MRQERTSKRVLKLLFPLAMMLLLSWGISRAQEPEIGWSELRSIAWSPDGTRIAIGGGPPQCGADRRNYAIKIIEVPARQLLIALEGHRCQIGTVAWNGDGTKLVSGSADGTALIWNASTGDVLVRSRMDVTFQGRLGEVWSPDGLKIADLVPSTDLAYVWDAITGQALIFLDDPDPIIVSGIDWSPDGSKLATGTANDEVRIWDSVSGQLHTTFTGTSSVAWLDWSPDGSRIAIASSDTRVRILDAETGQILLILHGHTEPVYTVIWSPDSTRVASSGALGNSENTVRVWDAVTGQQLAVYPYPAPVFAVTWRPDGQQLAFGGSYAPELIDAINIVDVPFVERTATPTPSVT